MEENIKENEEHILKSRGSNLLLTDYQVSILKRNQIDYENYPSTKSLLFRIEEELNDNPDADYELEILSQELAERSYYQETNK